MKNIEYIKLIEKIKEDDDNFNLLLEKLEDIIDYYANSYYIDNHDSEDIESVIYTIIWKNLEDYDHKKGKFLPFIRYRIYSALVDLLKKSQAKKRTDSSISFNIMSYNFNHNEIVDKSFTFEDRDEFCYLNTILLDRLSPLEQIIYAYYVKSYGRQYIAKKLFIDIRTVHNGLARVKKKAKKIYKDYKNE